MAGGLQVARPAWQPRSTWLSRPPMDSRAFGGRAVLPPVEEILSRIEDGSLLPADYYSENDNNAALDARDSDRLFENAYIEASKRVEAAWKSSRIDKKRRDLVEHIRENGFMAVTDVTSNHEIASYVSDDLEVIAQAAILGLSDPILEWLWASYDKGEFPVPPVPGISGD